MRLPLPPSRWLVAVLLAYTAGFVAFWPRVFLIVDEERYVAQAVAFASGHGLLALVAVLGSLYPVMTVLLAHVILGERLTAPQKLGVAIALGGVCAIAAG